MSCKLEFALKARALGLAALAIPLCWFAPRAGAQVFEFNGGTSTLYQAGGGSVAMHTLGSETTIGAGMVGGHFSYGAKIQKMIGSTLLTAGDDQINILLPTDVFDASHYVFGRGFGMKTKLDGIDITAFGGMTSTLYETPIFEGAGSGSPMGFVGLRKSITPKLQLSSNSLFSDKMTQILGLRWNPARKLELAASAGVGANQPYAAGSVNLSRKYVDVIGSYVSSGPNFRRVVVSSPIQAEPNKGNLLVTLKPTQFFTLSGGTQNFLVPDSTTNVTVSSSVRQASANLQLKGAILSATVFDSSALGESDHAAAFTASRDFTRWAKIMSNYMVSKPQRERGTSSFFTTVTQNINQHLSVNENISTSNGQTSLLYGGSLFTNLVTFSANYETFYIPVHTGNPFQQSLMLDVSLHLFGRIGLHGATFVGPTGNRLYTATANAVAVRGGTDPVTRQPMSVGDSVLRVQVLDPDNNPIEGAALVVDSKTVFTSADGTFEMRERKSHPHALKVLTDQFLDGGTWEVQSVPAAIWSSVREGDPGAVVVVRRVPVQTSAARPETSQAGTGRDK